MRGGLHENIVGTLSHSSVDALLLPVKVQKLGRA